MLTLLLRTDKPEAELFLYKDSELLAEIKWEAHRQLAETINKKIEELFVTGSTCHKWAPGQLSFQGLTLEQVKKVGVYEGPGSFTGLRIGMSVANALAYSLEIPVVQAGGENWIRICLDDKSDSFKPVSPIYGSAPHITQPKK